VGQAIGQLLPLAVAAAISPVPIIASVLLLLTPRAAATGTAYVVGWLLDGRTRASMRHPERRSPLAPLSRRSPRRAGRDLRVEGGLETAGSSTSEA
jgi:hypothetical protein